MSGVLNLALSNSSILQSYQKHGLSRCRFLQDQAESDGISAPHHAQLRVDVSGFDQTMSFTVPRLGMVRRMPILAVKASTTGGTATNGCDLTYSALNCWHRIDLVSKTDTIETLTPEVAYERIASCGQEFFDRFAAMAGTVTQGTGADATTLAQLTANTDNAYAFCPLPFSFCMGRKSEALPLRDMEGLTIRVHMRTAAEVFHGATAVGTATLDDIYLRVYYDQLSPEDRNAYLQDAFGSDQKGTLYKQIVSAQTENAGTAVTNPTTTSEVKCTIHASGLFSKIHFWAHDSTAAVGTHVALDDNTKVAIRIDGSTVWEADVGTLPMLQWPTYASPSTNSNVYTIDFGDSGLDRYAGAGAYSGGLGTVGLGQIEVVLTPTLDWDEATYTCNVNTERLGILEIASTGESRMIARV